MVLLLHNCSYYSFFKISFVFSFKLEAIARLEAIANCPTCEESVSSQEVGGHRSGLPRRWLVSNHLRAHQPWGLRCWGGNRLSEKNSSSLCTHTHTFLFFQQLITPLLFNVHFVFCFMALVHLASQMYFASLLPLFPRELVSWSSSGQGSHWATGESPLCPGRHPACRHHQEQSRTAVSFWSMPSRYSLGLDCAKQNATENHVFYEGRATQNNKMLFRRKN